MTDTATSAAPVDVPRLRAVLCRVRQITGGSLLLFVVWAVLATVKNWRGGSLVSAAVFGAIGAAALVFSVTSTVSGNKTDDAKAAGPTDEFVAHCRKVLREVTAADGGLKLPVFLAIWGLGGALLVAVTVFDLLETPPHYMDAATHAMFAVAIALRPIWVRLRHAPAMTRELATLPPPPPPSDDLVGRTRELLAQGEKIQAIKVWRDATGVGLKEAKDAVDGIENQLS
jgi:hypothetical protein